jgi:hypothetical protein
VDLELVNAEISIARLARRARTHSTRFVCRTRPAADTAKLGANSMTHPVAIRIVTIARINRSGTHLNIFNSAGNTRIERTMRKRRE